MKNIYKALLSCAAAAILAGCGGGDSAPAALTTTPTTTTTSTTSAAALTGLSGSMESAAGLAIDGVNAGYYGNFSTFLPAGVFAPATVSPDPTMPSCSTGTAVYSSGPSKITYTGCKIGDATLDGVAGIVGGTGSYTVTFNVDPAHPLKITAPGADNKTATFTYLGKEVVTNLVGTYGNYTAGKVVLNVEVQIGTSSTVTLTNFTVNFSKSGTVETTTLDGKYSTMIKLSDFGVPATPGVPDSVSVEFTISTPTAVKYNSATDKEEAGLIRFVSTGFTMEVDFGTKTVRLITAGSTQEFPM
jgi:hypothetical protein